MKRIRLLLILAGSALCAAACGGNEAYGLCIVSSKETAGINDGRLYPMHSVVKFPQALYVADYMQANGISPDSTVVVSRNALMQDTWSPMLEMIGGEKEFSFRELLRLSLAESDNNACDLLFNLCGSPEKVDSFIRGLGVRDINVKVTERQMHDDITLAAQNSCTPAGMASLLLWFNGHKDDNACIREVWDIMASCNTGADRIPAAFGDGCRVIHKTGTGFSAKGGLPQINDAGVVILPDGQVLAIAVFIPEPDSVSDISDIVRKRAAVFE